MQMNPVNWFEIPALDYDRVVNFYTEVLGVTIEKSEMMSMNHTTHAI